MTLDENSTGTQITFTIRVTSCTGSCVTADFACYSECNKPGCYGLFAAFSFPGDGQLWAAFLPTAINSVRIAVPGFRRSQAASSSRVEADTVLTRADPERITCDVDLFRESDGQLKLHIRALTLTSFANPIPPDDRTLYTQVEWVRDVVNGIDPTKRAEYVGSELGGFLERTAFYYLRKLPSQIRLEELPGIAWHYQHVLKFIKQHLMPLVEAGKHPGVSRGWENDTPDMLAEWRVKYPNSIDLQLAQAVSENLPAIARGIVPPLQVMMQNGMLDWLYGYPNIKVPEVGAGTGGATSNILPIIKDCFSSYTYTDISPDPLEQGYEPASYDLIIASNVLHAIRRLEDTPRNCRRLLRLGGYIMLLEITRGFLSAQLIMGTLSGWFLDIEDAQYKLQLQRNRCTAISETDFYKMIVESIVCGRPGSDQPAELIAGLQKKPAAVKARNDSDQQQQGKQSGENLPSQVEYTGNEEEALRILQQHFVRALGRILQMSEGHGAGTLVVPQGIRDQYPSAQGPGREYNNTALQRGISWVPALDLALWPGLLDVIDGEKVAGGVVQEVLAGALTRPLIVRNFCSDDKFGVQELQRYYTRKTG
ncbi:hypothetical protein F4802DRAFT_595600 [Xylaria palmicola]|nr:hypothetical protein F4802DRAFT_595600 [Xylaria palmicola]